MPAYVKPSMCLCLGNGVINRKTGWFALMFVVAVLALGLALLLPNRHQGQKLAGRHSEYHKVYDGWWDVACDTAMDGGDRRCYVQYVDVYSPRPDFRAAMVEVVYRRATDGSAEPVVTFDIEPDLSFRDVALSVSRADGSQHPLNTGDCSGPKCSAAGTAATKMLAEWRKGYSLSLTLREKGGTMRQLSWPLGNINAILDDYAEQRASRNLP